MSGWGLSTTGIAQPIWQVKFSRGDLARMLSSDVGRFTCMRRSRAEVGYGCFWP